MSAFRNISVVISGDAAPLVRAYAEASSATQAFAREMSAAADSTTRLNAATSGMAAKLRDISAASAAASANTARWSESSAAARANVDRLAAASNEAAGSVRSYVTEAGLAASETGALRTAATQAATRVGALGEAAGAAAPETAALGAAAAEAAAGTAALGAGSQAAAAGAARVAAATGAAAAGAGEMGAGAAAGAAGVGAMSRTTSDAERIAGRLGGSLGLAGAQAGTMGAQITSAGAAASRAGQGMQLAGTVGAAALAIGLIAAVAGAVKFDSAMHNVASIDQEVRDNFGATESQILSMSRTLPQSAQTLAAGLYNIASSGIYGASAMGVLGVSARAASAGLTTTDTAAKAIVASLNAYGLVTNDAATTTQNATRVSDALFNTVNYGVISFEALTSAVANSVGNAAQAGVGIEQLGSALATMTLSGMSASAAGVSLNNLLSKLVKPSAALGQEFTKLGISQGDLSDTGTGLYGVMMKLQASGDANIQTLLKWFPEIRAVRGAMALFSGDGANYQRVFEQMGTAQQNVGATQRVFTEQMKSTTAQLDLLKNKVEATGISIGAALLPGVNKALSALTTFGGSIERIGAEVLTRAEPGFRALGSAIANVAGIIHDLHIDQLAGDLGRLALGAAVTGFDALATAVSATTGFLRDHESIVIAVAVAYGALKLEAVGAGFASLAVSARAALAAMDAQSALLLYGAIARLTVVMTTLGAVVPSVTAALLAARNEFALGSALSGTFAGALGALRVGFTGLSASAAASVAAMGLYGAAIVAVGIGLTQLAGAGKAAKEAIAQSASNFPVNDVNAYGAAIADAHKHQQDIANDWKIKGNDWADVLFPKLYQEGKAWGDQAQTLTQQQSTLKANLADLGSQLGLTQQQISKMADAAGVNLSQSLDKVDASGKTARQTMADLAAPLAAAGINTDDMSKAMDALSKSTDGAKESLQSFNDTLGLLQGNGIAVIEAQDSFAASLVTLKTQLASNKEGLVGNSDAATANRKAYLDALSAAGAYGSALSTYTGDAGAAQDATSTLTGQVAQTAIQSGAAADQVHGLSGAIDETTGSAQSLAAQSDIHIGVTAPGAANTGTELDHVALSRQKIDPESVRILVNAPGADQVAGQLDALSGSITKVPHAVSMGVSAPGAQMSASQVGALSAEAKGLPGDREVEIAAPGAPAAAANVAILGGNIKGLPPSAHTDISAPGTQAATDLVRNFIETTGQMPPSKWTDISAPGATASTQQTQQFIDTVGAMAASKDTHIAAPGSVEAKAQVDNLRAAVDALHDKSITVTTVQRQIIEQEYYTATSPGSPALTYGLQGAATGGEIRGPGTPTSDSILARLSDQEWVIQASSAAKYGRAAMASINAGTATVMPSPSAGYALGGQVSAVRPPGYASGGMVQSAGGWQVSLSAPITISVVGGATNNQTATIVGAEVQRQLGKVVDHIRAGVGR